MDEIKSAYEIAMQRTKDIKANKAALHIHECINSGKRLVSLYLEQSDINLPEQFEKYSKKDLVHVKKGFFQTLISNIVLPAAKRVVDVNELVRKAMLTVLADSRQVKYIFNELEKMLENYLEQKKELEEHIKAQFQPRLEEKEQQLSQQMGAQVKINPETDPEYMAHLKKNMALLDEKYNSFLLQVKQELGNICKRDCGY